MVECFHKPLQEGRKIYPFNALYALRDAMKFGRYVKANGFDVGWMWPFGFDILLGGVALARIEPHRNGGDMYLYEPTYPSANKLRKLADDYGFLPV